MGNGGGARTGEDAAGCRPAPCQEAFAARPRPGASRPGAMPRRAPAPARLSALGSDQRRISARITHTARTGIPVVRRRRRRSPPARVPTGRGGHGVAAGRTATARPGAPCCGPSQWRGGVRGGSGGVPPPGRGWCRASGSEARSAAPPSAPGGRLAGWQEWGNWRARGPGSWTWRNTDSIGRTAARRSAAHCGDARGLSARGVSLGVQRRVLDRATTGGTGREHGNGTRGRGSTGFRAVAAPHGRPGRWTPAAVVPA